MRWQQPAARITQHACSPQAGRSWKCKVDDDDDNTMVHCTLECILDWPTLASQKCVVYVCVTPKAARLLLVCPYHGDIVTGKVPEQSLHARHELRLSKQFVQDLQVV
jgi:hypothetical protein